MEIICSYCRKALGTKPPLEDDSVTHGMCPGCQEHFRRQWSGLSLGEYLDAFDRPIVVVDAEGRVVAANQQLADLVGRSQRELSGLLGGEAMECQYSRLPGGCGRTVHCQTCTIRNAVSQTLETGEPLDRVPAWLDQQEGRVSLRISTLLVQGVVRVTIEQASGPG